ncbi:MAG: PKD domain-containing protein, partial [Candidatus Marinimicrobia bacterium]|nr:PKD domain-containing protein [Candidatus Neomarinimicrobiota bacterium]
MKRITLSFLVTSLFCSLIFSQGIPEVSSLGSFFFNEGGVATFTVSYTPVNPGDVIAWNFGDSGSGSGSPVSHTYVNNGTYNLSVTVTNNSGSGSATGIVYISNVSPTVTQFTIPTTGLEGQSLTFTGAGTDPGTQDVLTYTWQFGDGNSAVGSTVTHAYIDEGTGTYTVTLLITDGQGGNGSQTGTISISNVNPVISQLNYISPSNESSVIEFGANVTDAGTSDVFTYDWNYGDGSAHKIYTTGNYVVGLDGTDDYLQFSSPVSNALSQFTVEVWVKGSGGTIFSRNSAGVDGYIQLGFNSTAQYYGSAGSVSQAFDGIPQNVWSHVAMTYDGLSLMVYVDGNLITSQSGSGLINTSSVASYLGRLSDGSDDFTGQLTDFRFWNSARTQTQIRDNIFSTLQGNESGLLTYNRLDEGSGSSSADQTSNGHTVTFGGNTQWVNTGGRHSYANNGTYSVILTVTDGDNGTHTVSNNISITNVNPSILSFVNPGAGDEGQTLSFSAYAINPGFDILTYTWNFGDNTSNQAGETATHTFADDGSYTITLTITDQNDGSTIHQSGITIANVNPTIQTHSIPDMGTQGTAVHFTAAATDPGTDTPVYTWNYGDGTSTVTGPDVYHTYTDYGTFTVSLTVTEEDGGTVNTTSDIIIVPDWNVSYSDYQSTASMTAVLYLDHELIGSQYNKVAAFSNGQTRGTAFPILVGSTWMYFMTLYANINAETITFKAYIADQELVLDTMESITFYANNSHGSPLSPFVWNTILNYDHNPELSEISGQTIEIGNSFTPFDLDDYLVELDGNPVSYLYLNNVNLSVAINSNHIVFVTPVNSQWTGSETIRFIVSDETDAALIGFQDVTFTIEPIDNPPDVMALNDQVVGKVRDFTSFDLDNSLIEMDGDDIGWSYEFTTSTVGDAAPSWSVNPSAFQFSMTVTASVSVRHRATNSVDHLLAAFSGNELRGVTSPVNVGGSWVYFLTIYSNQNGQPLEFSIYDPIVGDIIPVKETMVFAINGVEGN